MAGAVDVTDPAVVERWFVSVGTPTLIRGYSLRRHVLPRALSFLFAFGLAVFVYAVGFGSEGQSVFLLLLLGAAAAWAGARRARRARRPLIARPAAVLMLVTWFAWPVVVPLVVASTQRPESLMLILWSREANDWYTYVNGISVPAGDVVLEAAKSVVFLIGVWLVVSAAALAATWFGVTRLVGRALRDVARHVFDVLYIQSRTLPAMVFLTLFLLVNADMWQASAFLTPVRLAVALMLFAGVAFLATAAQLREERDNLMQRRSTVSGEAGQEPGDVDFAPHVLPPLTQTQRINVVLAFGARQIAQSVWVGVGVFVFLFALGLTVIPAATVTRWIGDSYQRLPGLPVPVALFYAAAVLAGFAAMYFAVTSMTDPAYRDTFFTPTAQGLQEVLRIHAAYAEIVGSTYAPTVVHRAATRYLRNFTANVDDMRRARGELGRAVRWRSRARGGDTPDGSAQEGESGQ